MRQDGSPLPEVGWRERLALNVMPPLQAVASGEITAARTVINLGSPRFKGAIKNVWLSVGQCGRDDSGNPLSLAVDVRLDGTTVLATQPTIAGVTGEAAVQKTTIDVADTGITAAVLDYTHYTFNAGATLECEFILTRTASPASEMENPCVVVELQPL